MTITKLILRLAEAGHYEGGTYLSHKNNHRDSVDNEDECSKREAFPPSRSLLSGRLKGGIKWLDKGLC